MVRLFPEARYAHGCYHRGTRTAINLNEVAAVQVLTDEPQNMMGGPWTLCKVTLRCGKELLVDAVPEDFIGEGD